MADLVKIVSSLHPLERKVLPFVEKNRDASSISSASKLSLTEVNRALQWLAGKELVRLKESSKEIVELGENGLRYLKEFLPERKFFESLRGGGKAFLSNIKKSNHFSDEELNICVGILKKKGAIELKKDREIIVILTELGKAIESQGFESELFIRKRFPVDVQLLSSGDRSVFEGLKSRKGIVKVSVVREIVAELTELGRDVLKKGIVSDVVERVSSELLKTGSWKGKTFRRYDINSPVSRIFSGKKQHYRRFLEEVREKFIALGFTEMDGPIVETEFWNMDALFMPQFHSARDIHDVYYVKQPKYASVLPKDIVSKVKAAHEKGVAGSKGWKYDFDVKRTYRHVLRSQDTSISPRVLSSPDLKVPGKYFQMVRCFRYDVIDATHLADFFQVGGFVVEKGINFRHLVGLLKLLAKEFAGTDEIKVVPAYFPFTEPSASLYAKHPEMGWIELGGSGIFRPEMTGPLGVKEPVIAWGIGVDRLGMFRLGLKDIRQLFSHDLQFLRDVRVV